MKVAGTVVATVGRQAALQEDLEALQLRVNVLSQNVNMLWRWQDLIH